MTAESSDAFLYQFETKGADELFESATATGIVKFLVLQQCSRLAFFTLGTCRVEELLHDVVVILEVSLNLDAFAGRLWEAGSEQRPIDDVVLDVVKGLLFDHFLKGVTSQRQ